MYLKKLPNLFLIRSPVKVRDLIHAYSKSTLVVSDLSDGGMSLCTDQVYLWSLGSTDEHLSPRRSRMIESREILNLDIHAKATTASA